MPWVFDPQSGGVKIPKAVQERTRQRILDYAEKHYQGKYTRLDIRFRGALCYIDAYQEPDVPRGWPPKDGCISREEYIERLRNTPIHLCRLRHFAENRWSLAFFTYSNEKYEPCVFQNGEWFGTPEEAFEIGATYLTD
jgi:hypothetical protein